MIYLFIYLHVSVIYAACVQLSVHRGQEMASDLLELELQAVMDSGA